MVKNADDRPGWGGWDYVAETQTGSENDPVESYLESTDLGVQGFGDEWRVVRVASENELTIDEHVWPTALAAMQEAERQAEESREGG